jgi:Flp pilus assembly pilin Flp
MTMRQRLRDERGASAVEFAFIVPLLIVLVLGIAEFGRAFQVQGTSRPPPARACGRWRCRTTRPRRAPSVRRGVVAEPGGHRRPDHHHARRLPGHDGHRQHVVRVTISYPMPFLTGFFGSGVTSPERGSCDATADLPPPGRLADERGAVRGHRVAAAGADARLHRHRRRHRRALRRAARLQVAADAAALAVAQDCARGNLRRHAGHRAALVAANDGEGATTAPPVLSSAR